MTLMEKIREYAKSNRPFRLQLSDTRILEVKGRDWISTHPSRAVTSVSIGDNFRSREFHGEESHPNLTKLPVPPSASQRPDLLNHGEQKSGGQPEEKHSV
jgi:hypothetical protein